jgi:hypothetical protein
MPRHVPRPELEGMVAMLGVVWALWQAVMLWRSDEAEK